MIGFDIVKSDYNPLGAFTRHIKWKTDKNRNGYIVQRVDIDDPLSILANYNKPFFEAWRVIDGYVSYDDGIDMGYDDEFSNDANGLFTEEAIENVQTKVKESGYTSYDIRIHTLVYWVDVTESAFQVVMKWKPIIGGMSNSLPASYDEIELGIAEKERIIEYHFIVE